MAENEVNIMRRIRIKDVTLNCGAVGEKLERAVKLLKYITGENPIKTKSKRRIPAFNIRPGLEIGCKVTLRGEKAVAVIKKLFTSVNEFKKKQFGKGKFSFGIEEYITIPGVQFQREIGVLGFDISVNLIRAGYSVKEKKIKRGKIPERQRISPEETIEFMEKNFDIKIKEGKK